MYFPDDLWNIIKDYQIDYKKNHHRKLKLCHEQIFSDHRPVYYKKVILGFSPGIADSPTWHNFTKKNKISCWSRNYEETMKIILHAIEITPQIPPNDRYYHDRDMYLYYGWVNLKKLNDGVFNQICSSFEFFPDYY